jgi:hypothetical protein
MKFGRFAREEEGLYPEKTGISERFDGSARV